MAVIQIFAVIMGLLLLGAGLIVLGIYKMDFLFNKSDNSKKIVVFLTLFYSILAIVLLFYKYF